VKLTGLFSFILILLFVIPFSGVLPKENLNKSTQVTVTDESDIGCLQLIPAADQLIFTGQCQFLNEENYSLKPLYSKKELKHGFYKSYSSIHDKRRVVYNKNNLKPDKGEA